ncbi:MAG TPA: DUF86 domain-containing protein [Segetibacter sp.]|jgi:uncharacterized protein with HEPN domain
MFPSQVEFLQHILHECLYLIKESEDNTFDDFLQDERLSKAVCRSLEIIGEASNKIQPEIKSKYSRLPWREMSDVRNKIIHQYFGIDYDIVWDTVNTDIPLIKEWIEEIIKKEL